MPAASPATFEGQVTRHVITQFVRDLTGFHASSIENETLFPLISDDWGTRYRPGLGRAGPRPLRTPRLARPQLSSFKAISPCRHIQWTVNLIIRWHD